MIYSLHYLFPNAFYLLFIILLIIFLWWLLELYRKKRINKFVTYGSINKLIHSRSTKREKIKLVSFILTWIFAVLALAGPYTLSSMFTNKGAKFIEETTAQPLIFIVDVSASMGVKDLDGRTRLEVSKEIIEDMMPSLNDHPFSLYALTTTLTPVSPLTYDHLFFRIALNEMGINEGGEGTDIEKALSHLEPPPDSQVILFSDGGERNLKPSSFPLIAVGIGTADGGMVPNISEGGIPVKSKLEMSHLQELTKITFSTQKRAFQTLGREIVDTITSRENRKFSKSSQLYLSKENQKTDLYFQIPLFIAFITLFVYLSLLDKSMVASIILFIALPIFGETPSSIVMYNRGTQFLQQKRWKEADDQFRNISILGAPSARFVVYYKLNSAIAKYNLAKAPYTDPVYSKYFLESALKDLKETEKGDCHWFQCQNKNKLEEAVIAIQTEIENQSIDLVDMDIRGQDPRAETAKLILLAHEALVINIDGKEKDVEHSQKAVLDQVPILFITIQLFERSEYKKNQCQKYPWEEVIPLIDKGYNESRIADRLILEKRAKEALSYQNQAIVYWRQALQALQNQNREESSSQQSDKALDKLRDMYMQDLKLEPPKMRREGNKW